MTASELERFRPRSAYGVCEGGAFARMADDEVIKYGGVRCTTMQFVRDPGPRVFEQRKERS